MKNYEFTVVIEKDEEGNFLAICPALQGCYTEGKTKEDALKNIKEVIEMHIEDRLERKEFIAEEIFSEKMAVAV